MKKNLSTPQAEFDTFSPLPQGTEVWRGRSGVPAWPYEGARCYVKTSMMYDQLAKDPRTAPRVFGFILFTNKGYCGQFSSLAGALNVGMGVPLEQAAKEVSESIARHK